MSVTSPTKDPDDAARERFLVRWHHEPWAHAKTPNREEEHPRGAAKRTKAVAAAIPAKRTTRAADCRRQAAPIARRTRMQASGKAIEVCIRALRAVGRPAPRRSAGRIRSAASYLGVLASWREIRTPMDIATAIRKPR